MERDRKRKRGGGIDVRGTIRVVEETARRAFQEDSSRSVEEWRAVLLCAGDRWGMGKAKGTLKERGLLEAVERAGEAHSALRKKLAEREGEERVQGQRILCGKSLLTITRSACDEKAEALDGLLAAAIHPVYGVEGKRVEKEGVPQQLPPPLQPRLPVLPNRKEKCNEINNLLSSIYEAMQSHKIDNPNNNLISNLIDNNSLIDNNNLIDPTNPPNQPHQPTPPTNPPNPHSTFLSPEESFVLRFSLHTEEGVGRFGIPREWREEYEYYTTVPEVEEGSVLLWNAWHATAGAAKEEKGAKLVAFLDLVPKSFLGEDLVEWYEYAARNAPIDPGAGRGRGAWLSLCHLISRKKTKFGVETEGWGKVGEEGEGWIDDAQRERLRRQGFLVVKPPPSLSHLAGESKAAFQEFLRDASGYNVDLDAKEGEGSLSHMLSVGMEVTGSEMVDPCRPFERSEKRSRNAQGGGAILTKAAGMGAGTTYCNEEAHVAFQTSDFAANLFASAGGDFYKGKELIMVAERFRIKDQAAWEKGTHVDTRIEKMIPKEALENVL